MDERVLLDLGDLALMINVLGVPMEEMMKLG